uniref:UPAR/Ly6 domain-containing protein n=1 Tax=Seriola lalandi dorsalis TaxID=1841481 RepID=A0A3B4YTA7_SERLL
QTLTWTVGSLLVSLTTAPLWQWLLQVGARYISLYLHLQTQGCLASSLCNQTETGSLLTAGYTVNRTCCSTDCCNGAASIQFSLTAALGAALLAVWSNLSL